MTTLVFVGFQLLGRQRTLPGIRRVLGDETARLSPDDAGGNADIEDLQFTAKLPARHQQMAGLTGHEGDGVVGPEGGTQHLAGAAIKAGGQIDGEHRNIGLRDAADQRAHIV